jgi:hypothetical protein
MYQPTILMQDLQGLSRPVTIQKKTPVVGLHFTKMSKRKRKIHQRPTLLQQLIIGFSQHLNTKMLQGEVNKTGMDSLNFDNSRRHEFTTMQLTIHFNFQTMDTN